MEQVHHALPRSPGDRTTAGEQPNVRLRPPHHLTQTSSTTYTAAPHIANVSVRLEGPVRVAAARCCTMHALRQIAAVRYDDIAEHDPP